MKMLVIGLLGAIGLAGIEVTAQNELPGPPEENGLQPVTDTFFVNTYDTLNNLSTESLGVAIAQNGNVIIGWEDDGEGLNNLASVWTLYSGDGNRLIEAEEITSADPAYAGQSLFAPFRAYFRKDGSAVPGHTAWGPKIKANLFGEGVGMGATAYDLGLEVPELAGYNGTGDWPAVQLLTDAGAPVAIVNGVPETYAAREGDIRIGDWNYLATGNIVIVGESRQSADLVDFYGGTEPATHAIVRIVTPDGEEVSETQLVSEIPSGSDVWHGVGVTADGFAVRFSSGNIAMVRIFDNSGTPVSTNIDLAMLTGEPGMSGGGRGDGVGFHGNGEDAYAVVARGTNADGAHAVWVAVLNADGSLRWFREATDDVDLLGGDRCDVGIDHLGRVVVVYDDFGPSQGGRIVYGRLFDSEGEPMGGTFHVSEIEPPDPSVLEARRPRVAFRNDTIAVVWESLNNPFGSGAHEVAARIFVVPVEPGGIETVGLTRIVPDTVVINPELPSLGNWEPYASVLGTSVFLIEANTFAEGFDSEQRYVVAFQPTDGRPMVLGEGFFSDDGEPFRGLINASRANGNPGRVAGDRRPGAVNFMVGGETTVHLFEPFQSDGRWDLGFDRGGLNGRYATVQTFSLDPETLEQAALSVAQDSAHGRRTDGAVETDQISRFGGDVVALSNGNFLSVVDDRSQLVHENPQVTVATIFAPDGSVVKDTFLIAPAEIWANAAAFKDGFVVRVGGLLYFYDNDGNPQGEPVDQATSGESFDRGRGDGTRIAAHINSPYVFLAGKVTDGPIVRVAAWDARTREFVAKADVSEGGFRGDFNRATVASDALDRIVVAWVSRPDGYELEQVAARVLELDADQGIIRPLTGSFFPFVNAAKTGGIRTLQMSVAMTTREILVAAKGEINLDNKPEEGANSPSEINFFTVFSHPDPQNDPTPPVGGGGGGGDIAIASIAVEGANATIAWTGGEPPFTVQRRAAVDSGDWENVATTQDRTATVPVQGDAGFFRIVAED